MIVKSVLWITLLLVLLKSEIGKCSPITMLAENSDFFDNVLRSVRSLIEDESSIDRIPSVNGSTDDTLAKNVIESRKIVELPNGGQKIERLVENQVLDGESNNATKKLTEFFKFPNHTFRKIERDGVDLVKREETEIGCVDKVDCNETSYCDKLSYACKSCQMEEQHCSASEECCHGYKCDKINKVCKKSKGREGDYCEAKSDCDEDHCCALNNNADGVCQPYLREGQDCGKDFFTSLFSHQTSLMQEAFSGLPNKCPCHPGLKCRKHQTLPFLESEVCAKPTARQKKKKLIRIRIRKFPSLSFHNEADDLPLPPLQSFLPGGFSLMQVKNKKNVMDNRKQKVTRKRKYYEQPSIARRLPKSKNRLRKRQRRSKRHQIPFPFRAFEDEMFDGNDNDDDDDDEEDKAISKRELLEDMGDDVRDAVHDAVDGIFDNVMKGMIEALKYRL